MILRIIARVSLVILFFNSADCFGMDQKQLSIADSLFAEKNYTEAMESYKRFFSKGYASPGMLIKMAYVADATDDFASALYYLDLYYQKSGDRLAVGKIEELAEANDLYGYRYSDLDYLMAVFSKHTLKVFIVMTGLLVLLMAYVYKKIKQKKRPIVALAIQSFVAIVLLIIVNFRIDEKAMVNAEQSLLRSGPSAGAEPVEVIDRGHRVVVKDYSVVWSKIIWQGKEVFIRTNRLTAI